jgi:hypothetical protein
MATVEIHGMQQLLGNLQQLPDGLRRKVLRRALRQGAAMVRDEARRIVRRKSGALARVLPWSARAAMVSAAPLPSRLACAAPCSMAAFWVRPHRTRARAASEGRATPGSQRQTAIAGGQFVPPYPFMRPAAATSWKLL